VVSPPTRDRSHTPTGRTVQERAHRTREAVLIAAAKVFERSGYVATRLEEIVVEAKVSKGALYFHYPAKADVARAVVEAHLGSWAELARQANAMDMAELDRLGYLITEVAKTCQHNPINQAGIRLVNEYQFIDTELPTPFVGWVGQLSALLDRGKRDGTVASSVRPEVEARWLVGSFFGLQDMSARLTNRRDLDERVSEWWQFVRPSLERPTGG